MELPSLDEPSPLAVIPAASYESHPPLDMALLLPEDVSHHQVLINHTPSTSLTESVSNRLGSMTSNLEYTIDSFAHGIHGVKAYRNAAERVAGRILDVSAQVLEERDQERRNRAGMSAADIRDILGALSRIDR